ncbi:MAG: hypothetical protein JGK04_05805 [Microcoleus sp. PH2017_39_LGB_O_B]|uniref:hypothetical protein n=1 Tax=unclassified Microcoleus TaxID=2642155 RepID=UPI001DD22D07|nr:MULTISPECIES: hypothetical protein [unclassified Microcoleus]TAF89001.1 MAG: hypothetical protein EAZ49_14700 [Oscillatoriales cyanobacterium]MCC3447050.1 hypothetical protein [Microcoleus sp. PH2017_09_SFU_O_A]MCC3627961.1 hypothetical protein [Microcoleus sp. PH2017_39_LGB_O_B]MCC3640192.1 hypothetical protein [Microcoleus sp. PH2017_33_LGB_O_A]TAG69737.1 MAG: hypothetical protein EAZ23_25540 [Oscillatoriales cyanobacterium]
MKQNLVNLVNSIDFSSLKQWLTNLPLISKVVDVIGPVAAVVGLIVNLPKAYSRLRGIIVKLEVRKFTLVERVPGLVDFQLDLCIYAFNGNAVIREIYLVNKHEFYLQYNEPICLHNDPDNNKPSNKAKVTLAIPRTEFEFTQFVENRFQDLLLMRLRDAQIDILEVQVSENSLTCLTMAGRLKGKITDGGNFSSIPLENWRVLVKYDQREAETELNATIIDNNQTIIDC